MSGLKRISPSFVDMLTLCGLSVSEPTHFTSPRSRVTSKSSEESKSAVAAKTFFSPRQTDAKWPILEHLLHDFPFAGHRLFLVCGKGPLQLKHFFSPLGGLGACSPDSCPLLAANPALLLYLPGFLATFRTSTDSAF